MYYGAHVVNGKNVGLIVHSAGKSYGVIYQEYDTFRPSLRVMVARPIKDW